MSWSIRFLLARSTDVDLEHDPGGRSREEYNVTLTGVVGYISYRF